jgi:predicted DCC family thiol-disulfide oxidoreductase YuxK
MTGVFPPTIESEFLNESGQLRSRPDLRFPHPTERPSAIAVVFDGRCRFCTSQVRWLQRFDLAGRLSFISLHDPLVSQLWPKLTYDMLMEQIYIVPPLQARPADLPARNFWLGGILGVRYVAWRVPLLWPVALLLSIPGTLGMWQTLYGWIARNRYRFGRLGPACDPDGTCHLHFPEAEKPR